jgi:hypothetical protein
MISNYGVHDCGFCNCRSHLIRPPLDIAIRFDLLRSSPPSPLLLFPQLGKLSANRIVETAVVEPKQAGPDTNHDLVSPEKTLESIPDRY